MHYLFWAFSLLVLVPVHHASEVPAGSGKTTTISNLVQLLIVISCLQSIVWSFALVGLLTNVISAALHGILIFGAGLGVMWVMNNIIALQSASWCAFRCMHGDFNFVCTTLNIWSLHQERP